MPDHVKFSDLPGTAGDYSVLLFQPEFTVRKGPLFDGIGSHLDEAFNDAMKLCLVHTGSLLCSCCNDELGGPYAITQTCGGRVQLKPARSLEFLKIHRVDNLIALTCSNPECGMEVVSNECLTVEDFSNLIFHLMLKQMVPSLPGLSYVDCGLKEESHAGCRREQWKAIKDLGLISVAPEALWGKALEDTAHPAITTDWYSFGFMLTPGMRTMNGCGGYDEWLKFLVVKKFENLKKQYRAIAPMLLGPKLRTAPSGINI